MKSNPFNLHSVTPYLIVDGAKELIQFIESSFQGKLRGNPNYTEDGSIAHAEIMVGDSVIMLMDADEDYQVTTSALYVYVENCDKSIKLAKKNGAKIIKNVSIYPHGDKYGVVEDPFCNTWFIVTHVGR